MLGDKIIVLKEKPTQVLEEIPIDIAHKERHIGCHKIAKLEEYIYSITNQGVKHNCRKYDDSKRIHFSSKTL